MAGRFDECHRLFAEVVGHVGQADLSQAEEALAGVVGAMTLWDPAVAWSEETLATSAASPLPTESTLAFILWRQGDEDRAREWLAEHPVRPR